MKKSFLCWALFSVLAFAGCEKVTPEPDPDPTPDPTVSKATAVMNLTPDFISLSGIEEGAENEAGTKLTLTLTPGETLSSGFSAAHMEHIHVHVADTVYMPEFPAGIQEEYVQSLSLEIEVPDADYEVVACYSGQQQFSETGYTMYLEENEDDIRLYGVSPEKKYRYFDCYLLTPDAYTITGIEFKVGDGEWQDIDEVDGCSYGRSELVDNVYGVSVRPDYQDVTGDVTIRVSGEQHGRYSISWENAEAGYLDMEKSIFPAEAIDGETVTAELWVNNEYYLDGAASSVEGLEIEMTARSYLRFVMPASDLTVTLNILEKIPVSYTASEHVTEAEFYDADDIFYGVPTEIAVPGESVWLFASAEEGYKPVKAVLGTGESFDFVYYAPGMYMAEIVVPEDAQSLTASVETAVAYTVSAADGLDIMFNGGNLYAEGETVSMSIYVPSGQRIETVTATDAQGGDIPVTLDLPYASFTMPASDVTVDVVYEDINADDEVSVIAYFDSDAYDVSSSTNWDWDFSEGFTVTKGSTFYLSVYNLYGENFHVGVKVGETLTVYPADFDDMMGEYSFGKAIVADGDVIIKVAATEEEVTF